MSIGSPTRKRIVYLFNTGRIERLDKAGPDEFFYGALSLDANRFDVCILGPHPPSRGLIRDDGTIYPLPVLLRHVTAALKQARLTGLTFITRFLQCGFALSALNRADAIVAVTNPWIFALNLLRKFGLLRTPIVGLAWGPFAPPDGMKIRVRHLIRKILYSGVPLIFASDTAREGFLRYVSNRPDEVSVVYFGIDDRFWTPPAEAIAGDYVFAIGSAGRDYETLFQAWERQETRLLVLTSVLDANRPRPKSVEIRAATWHDPPVSDAEVRAHFQNSRYVVTPLVDSADSCGQSATLQAMACGRAVILSRTSGLWDSANIKHLENCYLVPPGDVEALRAALDYFDSRPDEVARIGANARATVERCYTSDIFGRRLEALLDSVIGAT